MKFRAFSIVFLLLSGVGVLAQTPPVNPPPKVMRIYREEVKPGMAAAHAKIEAGWPKAFAKAGTDNHYIAATSFSGANEALFFEPQDSYAGMEAVDARVDKNAVLGAELERLGEEDSRVLNSSRTWIGALNEELSRPGNTPIHAMRFIVMTTYRIRPGQAAEFTEFRKLLKSIQESTNAPNRYIVYNIASGAPTGTVIVLRALKSLAELDPNPTAQQISSDDRKKLDGLVKDSLMSSETAIYSIKPELSHAPKEFAAADPAFWGPKVKPASKSALKKEAKAAGTGQ